MVKWPPALFCIERISCPFFGCTQLLSAKSRMHTPFVGATQVHLSVAWLWGFVVCWFCILPAYGSLKQALQKQLCWSWLISLSWHTVPPHWHNWKGIGRWQRAENKSPEWLRNGNCGKYTAESACCVLGSLKRSSLLPVSLGSGAVLSNYKIFPGLCRPPQLVSVQLLMELGAELNWRIDPGRWLG